MGMTIDDDVKQKLLDLLAEEPTMVLSTAYAYAKNYVEYGEDITKAWTTALQQASVIQEVRQKAWVEAYDSFKKDYENRLNADMVAMLTEIQLEIEELGWEPDGEDSHVRAGQSIMSVQCYDLIQAKINALRGNEE